ncbi:MAG: phosphoglucosamine mutase [Actinomycetota bacterium]
MDRLFGTDGIRGIAGEDLTEDLARRLGMAAALVLRGHGEARPRVVVGRDTRLSGPALEGALAEGIEAAGGHVLLAGVQTTPAVAFLITELGAAAGAVISASHNPPEYNGIKLFGSTGQKLSDELEKEIEQVVHDGPTDRGPGSREELGDATERYVRHLVASSEGGIEGLRVAVDCANGASSVAAPETLRRLGAEVHPIFDQADGRVINVGCGAMHPEVVAVRVVEIEADAGVAHDGDADRALFADAAGAVIDGDQVLAACALALKERGRLAGDMVVTTVMANLGFHKAMREAGIEVLTTRVGDRYVLEEMLRTGAVIGGEQSGHLIFREHATTGDGILTAVKLLGFAAASGEPLATFVDVMRHYPQVLENIRVGHRDGLEEAAEVWNEVRAAERSLGERGRVLVRASGTEPLVRVMVEAETEDEANAHAATIAERVRASLGEEKH